MCSTSAEKKLNKTNTLVASFCWYLTLPGCACLCHGSLCSSCCLQHRTNTIHHSTGSLPGLLTGGSNFVLESKLALRFASKARFEPSVTNTVRLEGTSGQKLFSCSSSVKTRCIIPARNMARRSVTRSQDISAKAISKGSSMVRKHKRRSTKCQGNDIRTCLCTTGNQLGEGSSLQTSHCALVTQAVLKDSTLVTFQVLHSICFSGR